MCEVVVFAGTSDGRQICDWLAERGAKVRMSVATEYGREIAGAKENVQIHTGCMDESEMGKFMRHCAYVVDATHPYAVLATKNIKQACENEKKQYFRLIRQVGDSDGCIVVDSADGAAKYLKDKNGNVLLTTGSKDLPAYRALDASRLYPRVLPTRESLEQCSLLGVPQRNIICMQGPFSTQLNKAMLEEIHAKFLVTKDSGDTGGFAKKLEAARHAGVTVVVIGRPPDEAGHNIEQLKQLLVEQYGI